jgi:hypothetical protein
MEKEGEIKLMGGEFDRLYGKTMYENTPENRIKILSEKWASWAIEGSKRSKQNIKEAIENALEEFKYREAQERNLKKFSDAIQNKFKK